MACCAEIEFGKLFLKNIDVFMFVIQRCKRNIASNDEKDIQTSILGRLDVLIRSVPTGEYTKPFIRAADEQIMIPSIFSSIHVYPLPFCQKSPSRLSRPPRLRNVYQSCQSCGLALV